MLTHYDVIIFNWFSNAHHDSSSLIYSLFFLVLYLLRSASLSLCLATVMTFESVKGYIGWTSSDAELLRALDAVAVLVRGLLFAKP